MSCMKCTVIQIGQVVSARPDSATASEKCRITDRLNRNSKTVDQCEKQLHLVLLKSVESLETEKGQATDIHGA